MFVVFSLPFILLAYLFSLLFGMDSSPPKIDDMLLRPTTIPTEGPVGWLELIKSLIFWTVFLSVIGFSVYYYVHQHRYGLKTLDTRRGLKWLERFWIWLRAKLQGVNSQVVSTFNDGLLRIRSRFLKKGIHPEWRYINLRRMTPRQKVLFFYLAMIRRAEERGIPRNPSQTPYEYSQKLGLGVSDLATESDVQEDISVLTDQFVEALYSRHEVSATQANLVKRSWDRIRRVLKKASNL
ncbi:MAG: DUF4129 domain-containing protein [Anaerolineales bacterium]|nr:DUF4129 domain-containing protein [Anaerolineales bacterium]